MFARIVVYLCHSFVHDNQLRICRRRFPDNEYRSPRSCRVMIDIDPPLQAGDCLKNYLPIPVCSCVRSGWYRYLCMSPRKPPEKRKTVRIKTCSTALLETSSSTDQLLWHSEYLLGLLIWALLLQTFSFHIACPQLLKQLVCTAGAVQENTCLRFTHKHFLEMHKQKKSVTT